MYSKAMSVAGAFWPEGHVRGLGYRQSWERIERRRRYGRITKELKLIKLDKLVNIFGNSYKGNLSLGNLEGISIWDITA